MWWEVESHNCTDAELGNVEGDAVGKLWELDQASSVHFDQEKETPLCIEPENLLLWGNNNTNERRILYVILKRCTGFDYCADEKEAKKWFQQKQLKLIMNRHRFDAELIGEQSIIKDSFTEYFQVFSSVQQEIPFRLQRTKFED